MTGESDYTARMADCPTDDALARLASGDGEDAVRAHVAQCPRCLAAMAALVVARTAGTAFGRHTLAPPLRAAPPAPPGEGNGSGEHEVPEQEPKPPGES